MLLTTRHRSRQLIFALSKARKDTKHALNVGLNTGLVIARVSTHEQVFGDRHACEHAAPFWHHDQTFGYQIPGSFALDAFAQIQNFSICNRQAASNGFHGGGFARTIGANQRHQFALMHDKIHPFDGLNSAVAHLEPTHLQQHRRCGAGHPGLFQHLFLHIQWPPVPR